MSYRSSIETFGVQDLPDYIYYNADIINNTSQDSTTANVSTPDPPIRFNETRDSSLVKDTSQYHFSIIRFTMNGPGRDLPLFIPTVQVGQANPNLTIYSVAIAYAQSWNTSLGVRAFSITSTPNFAVYQSETQNATLAPTPNAPTTTQDLSSRYYWVMTYEHWVAIMNQTIITAWTNVWNDFKTAWATAGLVAPANPFPYPTLNEWLGFVNAPYIVYSSSSQFMSIYGDSDAYGQRLLPFLSIPYVAGPPGVCGQATAPLCRLFFNSNTQGLFANFPNILWNSPTIPAITYEGTTYPALGAVPNGYTYQILFPNKQFQNVYDARNNTFVPSTPVQQQKVFWINTQDFPSTDELWSPVSSLVFTTSLLPVRNEATGQPVVLGTGNLGNTATSQSAFTPIITDIAEDLTSRGAATYKTFTYYNPTAEYRMSDLSASRQDVRSIDIQVYWKYRLTNQLYPVQMYNQSSVSIKCMFRHKSVKSKGE
jgi:hypothetical protein